MSHKIEIILNGKKTDLPANWTLEALVKHLELRPGQVAIEVNEEIISRSLWPERMVNPGDRIEIVHFVGGGERTQTCWKTIS